jgi:hypothetical protein
MGMGITQGLNLDLMTLLAEAVGILFQGKSLLCLRINVALVTGKLGNRLMQHRPQEMSSVR